MNPALASLLGLTLTAVVACAGDWIGKKLAEWMNERDKKND